MNSDRTAVPPSVSAIVSIHIILTIALGRSIEDISPHIVKIYFGWSAFFLLAAFLLSYRSAFPKATDLVQLDDGYREDMKKQSIAFVPLSLALFLAGMSVVNDSSKSWEDCLFLLYYLSALFAIAAIIYSLKINRDRRIRIRENQSSNGDESSNVEAD